MGNETLFKFESIARRLIEGSFKRLFGGRLEPLEIGAYLARALEDNQQAGRAPTHYRVFVSLAEYEFITENHPNLSQELADYVQELTQRVGLTLSGTPVVALAADEALRSQMVRVEALHAAADDPDTTQVHRLSVGNAEVAQALQEADAYLIVSGRQHVPLDRPVTSIGRRMDNDVVLDSGSVSRQHAQIRWRYGRFILYDLSNRGRTFVNGAPVTEHVLQPGDVIGLSNVMLIYGEGKTGPHHVSKVQRDDEEITQMLPGQKDES